MPVATRPQALAGAGSDASSEDAVASQETGDGIPQLDDGPCHEGLLANSPVDTENSLFTLGAFGDLDGDGDDDAVVIVARDLGVKCYDIVAVLHQDGDPSPVASAPLDCGVSVNKVRIRDGRILLDLETSDSGISTSGRSDGASLEYLLQAGALVPRASTGLPSSQAPAAGWDLSVKRVQFERGAVSATMDGSIGYRGVDRYVVRASGGQTLRATLRSAQDGVLLSVVGENGVVLNTIRSKATEWVGVLPASQDYGVNVVAVRGDTTYSLCLEIEGSPDDSGAQVSPAEVVAVPPAASPSGPKSDKVVYLTFDDGPSEQWTPQVLDVLAKHDAHATFFVVGTNAQRFPDLIQAECDAGHAIANHTMTHQSLAGLDREAFGEQVGDARALLGDGWVPYLRPPYGAVDGCTRAYAEELGYTLITWDIDTEDWRQPGANAIVDAVARDAYSGAVVLMHDGGGDRSQTVEALDTVLSRLGEEGYRFDALRAPAPLP